ncbi:MAG TPA: (E)-4-hydroxy-3-methylbut-2-enyl-diphosphate synthase [Ignavibacteria bacterium]
MIYGNSLIKYSRFITREVKIGDIPLGGTNPIRLQSMTTTDTMNTKATVEQSIRIIKAGADYVRITAPSIKDANNLAEIKKELKAKGYNTPLIADIHFTPNAAETAARIVEKVRVNPGNYVDKKKFEIIEYTDNEYNAEIERIYERFSPLVKICKEYGTAMRIGTNHGSLSDRIMSRFGDTPAGMVESALEFLKICEDLNYYNIVLSMKASNPQVMVQAYRLLVNRMLELGMNYPLHLGVTEAGDGEDGRIKSAIGIGSLLEDGLGDTVRVSLTEDPEFEIPVCRKLVERYTTRKNDKPIPEISSNPLNPSEYKRRETIEVSKIGGKNVPVVILTSTEDIYNSSEGLKKAGYYYSETLDKWVIGDIAPDYIYLERKDLKYKLPATLKKIFDYKYWSSSESKESSYPLFTLKEFISRQERASELNFLKINTGDIYKNEFGKAAEEKNLVLILETDNENAFADLRRSFIELINSGIKHPVVVKRNYSGIGDDEKFIIYSSADLGSLFIEGFGDGIWLDSDGTPDDVITRCSFGILQASRVRISKTEYISCPSCGRTLFDLQETTALIKKHTSHLKGVKIGIMGCIVNGPGEMADADYGYVGSGQGKITLYKGKEIMKRNINTEIAVNELINLIKENGDWVEP